MKINRIALITILLIGTCVQGQFLKKLGKRVEKAAENTVLKKAEQETSKKTDQALNQILDMEMGQIGSKQVDPATLPSSYEFNWRYTINMSHENRDMKLHYFLSENGNAFGSKPELEKGSTSLGNMLMIMDPSKSATAILMDNGRQKTGMVISSPDLSQTVSQEADMDGYNFEQIGTKQILGYTCQGFQMKSEDSQITMYVAVDAPVSFNNMYSGSNSKHLPKGLDPEWLEKIGENSLMMEMNFTNKKNDTISMNCVALEKEFVSIDLSEYNFGYATAKQNQ